MKIINLPIDEIIPYERNPRKNDGAVDAVAASIREFGFKVPIVVDAQNVIVTGHTRHKAARKLGLTECPCIRADDLTPEQVRAYRLADNKVAELAEWDFDLLAAELAELPDFEMEEFGFEKPDQSAGIDDVVEDEVPETVEPRVSAGEIWQCGEHRIMCGDSANHDDIGKLMGGDKADFVFTDPPYGVAIGDKNKGLNAIDKAGKCQTNIKNDDIDIKDLHCILTKSIQNLREQCSERCSFYVASPGGGESFMMMMMMMQEAGLPIRHLLVWVKNNAVFSLHLDYSYRHEIILYTWGKKHTFYSGYSDSVIDDSIPLEKMTKTQLKDMVRAYQQRKETSVIYCDKPLANELHPTMKPVKLVARFMHNSSKAGEIVADIFGGSGTTMIAAEQLGRRARLMEIDPHYCDIIIARWEQFTGRKAERIA